ncbi:DUF1830 domain-containing protein [Nostoc sp.]|uniref:DUF1830 domain-containing protein n=1 Tax=Nostoc sp. TaxID=1180 RepID=UPI003593AED8
MTSKIQITYRNSSKQYSQTLRSVDSFCYLEQTLATGQVIVFEAFIDAAVEIVEGQCV